jgi:hypothetical protein
MPICKDGKVISKISGRCINPCPEGKEHNDKGRCVNIGKIQPPSTFIASKKDCLDGKVPEGANGRCVKPCTLNQTRNANGRCVNNATKKAPKEKALTKKAPKEKAPKEKKPKAPRTKKATKKVMTPPRVSPVYESPKKMTPPRVSPVYESPKKMTPPRVSPVYESPKKMTPPRVSPVYESPKRMSTPKNMGITYLFAQTNKDIQIDDQMKQWAKDTSVDMTNLKEILVNELKDFGSSIYILSEREMLDVLEQDDENLNASYKSESTYDSNASVEVPKIYLYTPETFLEIFLKKYNTGAQPTFGEHAAHVILKYKYPYIKLMLDRLKYWYMMTINRNAFIDAYAPDMDFSNSADMADRMDKNFIKFVRDVHNKYNMVLSPYMSSYAYDITHFTEEIITDEPEEDYEIYKENCGDERKMNHITMINPELDIPRDAFGGANPGVVPNKDGNWGILYKKHYF